MRTLMLLPRPLLHLQSHFPSFGLANIFRGVISQKPFLISQGRVSFSASLCLLSLSEIHFLSYLPPFPHLLSSNPIPPAPGEVG